ncbi:MarR family winged helix-turn-helix transcriptional regulator [Streptomyces sp. NPDC058378]|uniref:MarR family winged helix-turn-helix transcriptional regulator n=1 Tax=Streptomyces sp. NPDC058378 TaxID=3346469 RepID=UPI003661CEC8
MEELPRLIGIGRNGEGVVELHGFPFLARRGPGPGGLRRGAGRPGRAPPGRMTMGEAAAAGPVRAGGLTQQADRLAEAGLIRRERDTDDRRIVRLSLTPEGLALTDRVAAVRADQERELLAGLGPAERRRLTALLGTLAKTLGAGEGEQ